MNLLSSYNVPMPKYLVSHSGAETQELLNKNKEFLPCVVKAQVLAGGRGKGSFKNGFKGGVHIVDSINKAVEISNNMIGQYLVTKQTGENGRPCNVVLLAEKVNVKKE